MKSTLKLVAVIILSAAAAAAQHSGHMAPDNGPTGKPIELVTTDAITHRKVATSNKQAQAFFDQGLTLYYAFNDGDAVRSFRRAAELDPQVAMAYWGVALAAYPRGTGGGNPSDEKRLKEAREAIKTAMSMPAPQSDRIYIEALSRLFLDDTSTGRGVSDDAYRVAMKPIYTADPKDADAAALYALSIFYAAGDTVWAPDGKAVGIWQEMLDVLEAGLKLHPKHMGLTHTYIHGVEESQHPERALAAADALRVLKIFTPSFGHLVHMPAHIYVRTGNFQKSIESNEMTATMPTDTLSDEFRLWHYNHVLNFLLFSYGMQGNFTGVTHTLDRSFGFKSSRWNDQRPRYWVRFKRWEDILKAPVPPADSRPQTFSNWAWARTMAFIATGQTAKAETEREAYRTAAKKQTDEMNVKAASEQIAVFGNTTSMDEARIDAAIARSRGDKKAEIEFLQKAVAAEDKLPYSEPPISISPVRESLGGALLRNGQNAEAEKVFREDLRCNPGSGRSLFGLMTALESQGKTDEAQKVRKQYNETWKYADIKLAVDVL